VELLEASTHEPEVVVAHARAALTPRPRLGLARAVVDDGWSLSSAAAVCHVASPTACSRGDLVGDGCPTQKTVVQSVFMLTTVHSSRAAWSSAFSAPAV
jgi:hypothetical protein